MRDELDDRAAGVAASVETAMANFDKEVTLLDAHRDKQLVKRRKKNPSPTEAEEGF